ncbi:MAG: helix-turn-helix transcriptional regulator [Magnetococcales bacterium]|nr:helix-turn-helix transcriptional regulator [Magnetococcales bacterium]
MGAPQIIITPTGEQLAVIPLEEYRRLTAWDERRQELQAYDEARAALREGRDELVPAPFAQRLLEGENPLRVWREYRGLTLRQLARIVGTSPAYLSEVETGKKSGSLRLIKTLAEALRVDLDDLT